MSVDFANGFAPLLAFTDGDRWRPGIGDPTFIGWLTVVAYFATTWLCWRAARATASLRLRRFWFALAAILLFLGFNKQLDLQTALTFMGKDFAKATGWYENRRIFQFLFIIAIALAGAAGTAGLFWFYKRDLPRLWPALAGIGFLCVFIVARAASFHHVDQFLNFSPGGVKMNWVLELGGIAWIAWPAWKAGHRNANSSFVWVSGNGARGPATPRRAGKFS